ncbi:hypothetical protein [Marinimicrobium agarilyticum]|uniref:hypothetical protein n=1 Tax=Marinimicrobium agarilyticum TaxID=306546 RepID=UPI0012F68AF8|nr:hypothetical protein [Marinimicrobium agarilyticum]
MSIRKAIYVTVIALLLGFGAALLNQHSRWLIFYGASAAKFANRLLLQEIGNTPEWAIDWVINSDPKEQIVLFSVHDSELTYAYSPNEPPSINGYFWQHLVGPWYAGKVKI